MITLPNPNPVPNSATLLYNFAVSPTATINSSLNTNIVYTQINSTQITSTKSVSSTFAKLNDVITYTIVLVSSGDTTANNVIFTDTIPNGTQFVTNSFAVNGVPVLGVNPSPPLGVNLGSIGSGRTTTLTFNVLVTQFPTPNPIVNSGTTTYRYTVTPTLPDGSSSSTNTNLVQTLVSQAIIDNSSGGLTKSVDKASALLGDTLTYTIVLKNTGNVAANNIVVTDTIPTYTSFITNSITRDGVVQTGAIISPPTGYPIITLNSGATTTLTFRVTVITLPTINPITNNTSVTFTYTLNPSIPNGQVAGGNSNTVNTVVYQAIIDNTTGGLVKYTPKANATINEIIPYTITLTNTGNTTAYNVVVTDTIPFNTSYVANSLALNGVNQPGAVIAPPSGFTISQLSVGQVATITFNVQVVSNPSSITATIPNTATVNFQFINNPALPVPVSGSGNSNTVITNLFYANISTITGTLMKYTNKNVVQVGETITYTIVLGNSGVTPANNVIFYDTIPTATAFVPNTVTINGLPSGADPQSGIPIGTINPGAVNTVTFDVIVTTNPASNIIPNAGDVAYTYLTDPITGATASARNTSNTVTNPVAIIRFNQSKSASPTYADIGDTITYTLILSNNGNVTALSTFVQDTIPNGTTFVTDSIFINGGNLIGYSPEIGFPVGPIAPNATDIVSFKVLVVSIPNPNPITNTFNTVYTYTLNGNDSFTTTIASTAQNNTFISNGSINMVKTSNRTTVTIPDTITYTIVLTNTGNATDTNVVFTDNIPTGTTFIAGTLTVNSIATAGNPATGVAIGDILPYSSTTVTFQVAVVSIPSNFKISNSASSTYSYLVNPNSIPKTTTTISNTLILPVSIANLQITKTSSSDLLCLGSNMDFTLTIKNIGNITATNILILDTLPSEITFNTNSLYINNVNYPGVNISTTGATITSIGPSLTYTVSFNAKASAIPTNFAFTNTALATYSYTPDTIPVNTNTISNTVPIIVSYCISNVKTINPCVINSSMPLVTSSAGTLQSSCTCTCDCAPSDDIQYSVLGLCTAKDFSCISDLLATYNMWSQNVVDGRISLATTTTIADITSLKGCLTILRNDTISSPTSYGNCNLEGKFLTGSKRVIEAMVNFTLEYVDSTSNISSTCSSAYFSSYVVIPSTYSNASLKANGCIEDLTITQITNNTFDVSSLVLLYLAPSSTDCSSIPSCLSDCSNNNCISNSNITTNISNFLSPYDYYWSEFNAYSTESLPNNISIKQLISVEGSAKLLGFKVVTTPEAIDYNEEGLFLTGKKLFINILLSLKLNYLPTSGSNALMRISLAVPCSTYIVVNDYISNCDKFKFYIALEDIYACLLDSNSIFTNTTLIVKAVLCN